MTRGLVIKRAGTVGAALGAALALSACNPDQFGPLLSELPDGRSQVSTGAGGYLAARFAQSISDHTAAAEFLGVALEADPKNVILLRRGYQSSLNAGRYADSLEIAEELKVLASDAPEANLRFAVESIRADDFQTALGHLEVIESQRVGRYAAPLLRSWVQVGLGDLAAARQTLEPLAQSPSFRPLYQIHLGLMSEVLNDTEAAAEAYGPLLEDLSRLPTRLGEIVGSFLERQDRKAAALAVYSSMEDQQPNSVVVQTLITRFNAGGPAPVIVSTMQQGFAEALFHFATALEQDNAHELALSFTRLSLLLRPDDPAVLFLLAEILRSLDRPVEAILAYERIRIDSPRSWDGRLRAAMLYEIMGVTEAAKDKLATMATERPRRIDPLVELGRLHHSLEDYPQAITAYDGALGRVDEVENHHWVLFYRRGMALERDKQWPRAEKDFLKALELQPDHPLVLNYLGYSWIDQGLHLEKARGMIERAVEQRPNDGYIVDSLGWADYRLGNYESAVIHLERAVELRPQDPVINDHLGDALWHVGRHAEARFQWRRALSLGPEPDLVAQIEAKLAEGLAEADPAPSNAPVTSGAEREG
ncbi:MAG: tetratricopeptide repeat protein [Alphaproteobacteria bacterium]|nr:tetratricopeptide repeat protein [Alphaproteobacteria bacterium]